MGALLTVLDKSFKGWKYLMRLRISRGFTERSLELVWHCVKASQLVTLFEIQNPTSEYLYPHPAEQSPRITDRCRGKIVLTASNRAMVFLQVRITVSMGLARSVPVSPCLKATTPTGHPTVEMYSAICAESPL